MWMARCIGISSAVTAVFFSCVNPVCANTYKTDSGFYLGAFSGISIAKVGQDQTIVNTDVLKNQWIYNYTDNSSYRSAFLYGLDWGYEFALQKDFFLDLGITACSGSSYSSKGKISLALGGKSYYINNYSYDVTRSMQLMVETKIKWKIRDFLPYISGGIGSGWNRSESYSVTPSDTTNMQMRTMLFATNQNVNFAYQIGFGIDYQFSSNNYLGIAYKYVDLGKANFGTKDDIKFPHQLNGGTLATNNITINFTHRFE